MAGPCVHQHRAGSGEPLLLIHGIGSNWRIWKPILPALEARHEVLAVSLPGYGESPPLDREPTVPALTDAVEEELDAAGLDRPHLAGNSLGGWIAAELARRGRAQSVVAISPGGMWSPKELAYCVRSLKGTRVTTRLVAPVVDKLARSAVLRTALLFQVQARGWRADPDDVAYAVRQFAAAESFDGTLDWVDRGREIAQGVEQIDCPFLVVWGSWDFLLPIRQGRRWARLVPGAELRELPRLGHAPMADDPELVATAILDFTARHARAPEPVAAAGPKQ